MIIDEKSFNGKNLLIKVDRILRQALNNENCFGGIPIIFFGDLFQLAPVKDCVIYNSEFNKFTDSNNYNINDDFDLINDELNFGDN